MLPHVPTPPKATDGKPIQLPQHRDHQSPQPEGPQHQSMKHLPHDGKKDWTADATLRTTGCGQNFVPRCQPARLTRWGHADMCRCAVHVGMQGDDTTAMCILLLCTHTPQVHADVAKVTRAFSKNALACKPLSGCTQFLRVVHAYSKNPVARS